MLVPNTLKYIFILERNSSTKLLDIQFIHSEDQLADGFTKPITAAKMDNFRSVNLALLGKINANRLTKYKINKGSIYI